MKNNKNLVLFSLFASIFADSVGWGIIFPILDTLIIGNAIGLFHASTSIITRNIWYELLIGSYSFCMFLTAPILGSISDRYGRKGVLIISLLGSSFGFLICAAGISCKSLGLLFAGRLVSGLTAGNFGVAQAAIADQSTHETLPYHLSLILLANGIGFACGPILGSLLLNNKFFPNISFYAPFLLCAIIIFIVALMLIFLFRDTYSGNPSQKIHLLIGLKNMYEAFTIKTVYLYFIAAFLFMLGYTIFFCNMPIFFEEKFGTGGTGTGYIMTYFALIFTVGLLWILPKLTKRFSLEKILISSLIALIISYILFAASSHLWMIWILLIPAGMAIAFIYVTQVSLISTHTSKNEQGKMMGVIASLVALTWGCGPIFAGFLMKGGIPIVYTTSVILIFAALLLISTRAYKK